MIEDKIKEAAEALYPRTMTDLTRAFIKGATSQAAKEYWASKQEETAIEFTEWVSERYLRYSRGYATHSAANQFFTILQLYAKFLEETNNSKP